MLETKVVQVANNPDILNRTNEIWGSFGWNVSNVQVTHSQNTKTYTKGLDYYTGNKTVETTTINYVTITYQRDKGMPNYGRIVELEEEYNSASCEIETGKEISYPPLLQGKDWIIVIFLAICRPPFGLVLAAVYLGYKSRVRNQKNKIIEEEKEKAKKKENQLRIRQKEILREAEQLLVV